MSLFAELFNPKIAAGSPGPLDDYWYMPLGYATECGEMVSPETAMRLSTVYACVKILAESLASLPLIVYRKRKDGGKDKVSDHWLYNLLHDEPNATQTSFEWREMMEGHLCLRGNAYSFINWGNGKIDSLVPIHPDRVEPIRMTDGSVQYKIKNAGGNTQTYLSSEILHIPGLSFDGLRGLNPIEYTAQTLGLSMAAEKFGAKFFKNGAKSTGVVQHPGQLSDKAHENLRSSIQKQISGDNIHSPLILEEGAKWEQLTVNPEDAQFLETRKYQATDICKIFRVPPHMAAELDKATFNNIEHLSINFVIHTMRPWFVRWEHRIKKQLVLEDNIFAEFKIDGLLRGDTKSRYEAYSKGIQDGWLNRNEVREMENLNPEEGLNKFLQPLNMTTAGQQPENPQQTEPQQQEEPNQRAVELVISDIAGKIANSEIKAINGRIDKAAEDRERFKSWVKDFSEKQKDYSSKCVRLIESITHQNLTTIVDSIAESLSDSFCMYKYPEMKFSEFQSGRKNQIENILREAIK